VLTLAPFAGWDGPLDRLTTWCAAVGGAVDRSATVPYPNPMGLPAR
jgi:hypothetical protein